MKNEKDLKVNHHPITQVLINNPKLKAEVDKIRIWELGPRSLFGRSTTCFEFWIFGIEESDMHEPSKEMLTQLLIRLN